MQCATTPGFTSLLHNRELDIFLPCSYAGNTNEHLNNKKPVKPKDWEFFNLTNPYFDNGFNIVGGRINAVAY
jgi:hypothetical protein